ncbi:hypothetical protein [Asaia sp. HN010]|uniref:hypothetical protein n=1 Tax=Asaia sp. HN010 TaxID=3081233 RepID=UPI003019CB1B
MAADNGSELGVNCADKLAGRTEEEIVAVIDAPALIRGIVPAEAVRDFKSPERAY